MVVIVVTLGLWWDRILLPTGCVFQKQGSCIESGRDFISGCFRNSAGGGL